MKEFFSSFFSSANIIVRATLLSHRKLPLQGAMLIGRYIPRALPWAMEDFGLSARFRFTLAISSYIC